MAYPGKTSGLNGQVFSEKLLWKVTNKLRGSNRQISGIAASSILFIIQFIPPFYRIAGCTKLLTVLVIISHYIHTMKAATIHDIKQELATVKPAELVNLCLRLARFKKENKELLTYLLFESHDEKEFVDGVKKEIDEAFLSINSSHVYYAKKSLRKILKMINKYCRYSGSSETETELRLHFCATLKESGLPVRRDKVLSKLYQTQLAKIKTVVKSMHEDLQYDYERLLHEIEK